jgi:hypothetical protein
MSSTIVQNPAEQITESSTSAQTASQPVAATIESESPTFTRFSKLSPELRRKVWRYFDGPSPRDVQVTITTPGKTSPIKKAPRFKSLTPIPPIMHVCHESREEGLKTFKTIFKVKDQDGIERREIYVNPELDTLFVRVPCWTHEWKYYTGGHLHLNRPAVTAPLDPLRHNIFRCQITGNPSLPHSEIIVVVQPTTSPATVSSSEQTNDNFEALRRVAGEEWKHVEFYVWKAEWWHEHWEFLFEELMKDEPPPKRKRGRKRAFGGLGFEGLGSL